MRTPRAAGGVDAGAAGPRVAATRQTAGWWRARERRTERPPRPRSRAALGCTEACVSQVHACAHTTQRTCPPRSLCHCTSGSNPSARPPGRGPQTAVSPRSGPGAHTPAWGLSSACRSEKNPRCAAPRTWSVRAVSGSRYRAERRCGHGEARSSAKLVRRRARRGASPTPCTCSHSEQHSTMGVRINR